MLLTLNLERHSRYYVINLVFPCALIACMVFFTFVLPPECGERVSLCITILMAMTIFQELTSEKLPPSSDTFFLIGEYISNYFSFFLLPYAHFGQNGDLGATPPRGRCTKKIVNGRHPSEVQSPFYIPVFKRYPFRMPLTENDNPFENLQKGN